MPVSEIRFLRLHTTEEAARASVQNDLAAFKAEFPNAVKDTQETMYLVRFIDEGLIGCELKVTIEVDGMYGVGGWLDRLFKGKLIESNPLRR